MPVRIPDSDDDVPEPIIELLEVIEEEFPHEHCLFFADASYGGFGDKNTIWMYYPDRRERPNLCPENMTYLATITSLVEEHEPATYSHVAGMEEHDYPDGVPEGATDLTKIHPKDC